jgi:tetratricopeptide (TPR) repeat protein
LAYHQSQRLAEADHAYRRALQLNHDLGEARYNLGCLLLEQNKLQEAKSELLAFTLRTGNSVPGLLKLGSVQLRLREVSGAEKSYSDALRIDQELAEAWNGLGMARMQRGRPIEALQYMNRALKADPAYPAALLNAGIITQFYLKDPNSALPRYRAYLALKPAPENADSVRGLIRQLEAELAPLAPRPRAAVSLTNNVADSPRAVVPNPNLNLSVTNQTVARPSPTRPESEATPVAKATPSPPPPRINSPATPTLNPSPPPAASSSSQPLKLPVSKPLESVRLADEPTVREATASQPAFPPAVNDPRPSGLQGEAVDPMSVLARKPPPKKGFFEKINPLKLFSGEKEKKPARTYPNTITVIPVERAPAASPSPSPPPQASPAPVTKRYAFVKPARPVGGKSGDPQPLFSRAMEEQRARRFPEAADLYRAALKLDPSLFEAHYNLAQVLAEAGNTAGALAACESALALRPDSADGRYNFALLLKESGYFTDAAQQLETLLASRPNEVRGHLAAGNLYAQQLRQPTRARTHYLKVLELDPRHPQAGVIAYWLNDHP